MSSVVSPAEAGSGGRGSRAGARGTRAVGSASGSAFRSAALATGVLAAVALFAASIRLLPWLLDPDVPWRVIAPFARGLGSLALEAAIFVGWPVGWALACARLVESGEARVFQLLGQRPFRTVAALAPQAALVATALALVALVGGRDAAEPGRVVNELVGEAKLACTAATEPRVRAVPFTELAWLCGPDAPPRLVGATPGVLGGVFSASDGTVSGDLRELALTDARAAWPGGEQEHLGGGRLHVGELHVRGMTPWARASSFPALLRAVLFAVTGALVALLVAGVALSRSRGGRLGAIVLGAAGPLAALGVVRLLERSNADETLYALMPVAGAAATLLVLPLVALAAGVRRRARARGLAPQRGRC